MLPGLGFFAVVGFAVCGFSGDGVQIAPGGASGVVDFSLFLFGQLLIGGKLIHIHSPFSIQNVKLVMRLRLRRLLRRQTRKPKDL